MRILVVEDDPVIGGLIQNALEAARFQVDLEADGETGLAAAETNGYGAIVLDLMLPRRDGVSICQSLRARRNATPILMLTARDGVEDRIRGLEAGADDYLSKPFDFNEMVARLRALLRRDKIHRTRVIRIADLTIDTSAGRVWRGEHELRLTPREYTLLEALALNEGRILTREEILERVWMDDASYSNTVTVHVVSLRKKVDGDYPTKLIHTVHGRGYLLQGPDMETSE